MDRVDYLAQAYSQAPWRKQIQLIVIFLLGLVVIATVAGIYLSVSAGSVELGHKIQDLQVKIEDTERSISDLETNLAFQTSTSVMQERARDMGLEPVSPEEILYISVPGYTGRPTANLAPPPNPTMVQQVQMPPAYNESLIDWLKENVFSPVSMLKEVQP